MKRSGISLLPRRTPTCFLLSCGRAATQRRRRPLQSCVRKLLRQKGSWLIVAPRLRLAVLLLVGRALGRFVTRPPLARTPRMLTSALQKLVLFSRSSRRSAAASDCAKARTSSTAMTRAVTQLAVGAVLAARAAPRHSGWARREGWNLSLRPIGSRPVTSPIELARTTLAARRAERVIAVSPTS